MSQKKYCGNAKWVETKYGQLMKLSLTADDVKMLSENLVNGWVNADVLERRQPSAGGMTHYIVINEWNPEKQEQVRTMTIEEADQMDEFGDLPF